MSPHDLFASLVFVFRSWYKLFVPNNRTPLGAKLQEARTAKGLSQTDLAEAVGATRRAVQFWEAGRRTPRMENLVEIASVTEKPLAWFFEEVPA